MFRLSLLSIIFAFSNECAFAQIQFENMQHVQSVQDISGTLRLTKNGPSLIVDKGFLENYSKYGAANQYNEVSILLERAVPPSLDGFEITVSGEIGVDGAKLGILSDNFDYDISILTDPIVPKSTNDGQKIDDLFAQTKELDALKTIYDLGQKINDKVKIEDELKNLKLEDVISKQEYSNLRDAFIYLWKNGHSGEAFNIAKEWSKIKTITGKLSSNKSNRVYKAIYNQNDNFESYKLDIIQKQISSVAAVVNDELFVPFCSASLVAPNIVLTAAHCFTPEANISEDYDLLFNFQDGPGGMGVTPIVADVVEIAGPLHIKQDLLFAGTHTKTNLDYVFLKFRWKNNTEFKNPHINCLRQKPAKRQDAIYSLGFPDGARMRYHSNGRVYLPYKISNGSTFDDFIFSLASDEFTNFWRSRNTNKKITELVTLKNKSTETENQNSLYSFFANLFPQDEVKKTDEAKKLQETEIQSHLDAFEANATFQAGYAIQNAYTDYKVTDDGQYRTLEKGDKGDHPTLGISLDLFSGDSGAPIFSMKDKNQCIIGILNKGIPDEYVGVIANYSTHESVLPIESILQHLAIDREKNQALLSALITD